MPFSEGTLKSKRCPQCKKRKSIGKFNRSGPGMRRSQCTDCEKGERKTRDALGRTASTRNNIRRRYKVLQHYSGKEVPACDCCGETTYEFLSIDHANGDGNKHRQEIGRTRLYAWLLRNGLPPGFRVLCHNCNQAIGANGFCPHQRPELALQSTPELLRERRQSESDAALIAAASRLQEQAIPVTASALAGATGASLHSVEKRIARLRANGDWLIPRRLVTAARSTLSSTKGNSFSVSGLIPTAKTQPT